MGKLIDQQVAIGALCRRCDLAAEDDEPCTEKCNDIKILEKLPSAQPEQCEDAISRQDAINALDDEITITGKSNAYVVKDYVQRVKRKLEKLPSVTPKRKTGKWIRHPEWEADGECGYECDQCGMGSDVDYNFCRIFIHISICFSSYFNHFIFSY